jgi:8-oxo-dGTP pyrophosphatase MutT (NUDIX family)
MPETSSVDKGSGNGSNLIVVDDQNRILVVRERTRKQLLMLPGGEIERGESPRHAAQEETFEETGLITDEADFRMIGVFVQRPKGVVFLYETFRFTGTLITEPTEDTAEAFWMSQSDIIQRADEFRTAYLRMIIRYLRCVGGIDSIPFEGRLSDTVEYPKGLDGRSFTDLVLRV